MDGEASKAETDQPSKKRKVAEIKTVVRVRIEGGFSLGTQLAPPSDSWSWRKYGQKPIKGSPFPRGYYRCSASKGCTAKKQVERCKTDESVLVITYSSSHNHPDYSSTTSTSKKKKKKKKKSSTDDEILFHYDLDQAITAGGDHHQLFSITEADQTTRGSSMGMGFEDVLEAETDQEEAELIEMENDFFYELDDLSVPHYLYYY